jgi:aerobic-type carbon monoxide dehydrogenase small subunit (CoxS/CutS family)
MEALICFNLNGKDVELKVPANKRLLDLLREDLGLMGTKEGCGEGECGACTILLNGKAVNSCLLLAVEANGSVLLTIEGLSQNNTLHPLQKAFIDEGAVQCGFCTPGMILASKALLDENAHPTDEEIKVGLSGNFCRCTGYSAILRAVKSVSGGQTDDPL